MIKLNDYLYSGYTVPKIIKAYSKDLRTSAKRNHNQLDLAHSNFLVGYLELLEHNDFLTSQSQRIREFYKYLAATYPFLAFTLKGRIKSLIRSEEKFNAYIMEYIYDYFTEHKEFPSTLQLKEHSKRFRDLIAYRIVISLPKCHLKKGDDRHTLELKYLYEIANALPEFMEQREFSAEPSGLSCSSDSPLLTEDVKPYYRDYITTPLDSGYQSLHIAFYDNLARCYLEVQIRTQEMDDFAEIGFANHTTYEKQQNRDRMRRSAIQPGQNQFFDESYERFLALKELDLTKVDVNLFSAASNSIMNDSCGFKRGRLILPYEHLSRFQNDQID